MMKTIFREGKEGSNQAGKSILRHFLLDQELCHLHGGTEHHFGDFRLGEGSNIWTEANIEMTS